MIPTWEQMHAAILQQMDESEKTTGVRKATQGRLAKEFSNYQGEISIALRGKFKEEFANAGFVCIRGGGGGFHGGIYEKDFAAKITLAGPKSKYSPQFVKQKVVRPNKETQSITPTQSDNVLSLIDRLDAPVEKKSIETLLAEQIRLQLDRNAQFADRIFQIAMGA